MGIQCLTRLNAKVQSFTDTGGMSELSPSDIAAALTNVVEVRYGWKRLTDSERAIGRVALIYKYTGLIWGANETGKIDQKSDFAALVIKVLMYANKRGWLESKKESQSKTFTKLTELCLREQYDTRHCGTCDGADWPYVGECPTCHGSKQGKHTPAYRARSLHVPRTTYIRKWEPRRNEIAAYFLDLLPELEWQAATTFKGNIIT